MPQECTQDKSPATSLAASIHTFQIFDYKYCKNALNELIVHIQYITFYLAVNEN